MSGPDATIDREACSASCRVAAGAIHDFSLLKVRSGFNRWSLQVGMRHLF